MADQKPEVEGGGAAIPSLDPEDTTCDNDAGRTCRELWPDHHDSWCDGCKGASLARAEAQIAALITERDQLKAQLEASQRAAHDRSVRLALETVHAAEDDRNHNAQEDIPDDQYLAFEYCQHPECVQVRAVLKEARADAAEATLRTLRLETVAKAGGEAGARS